MSDSQLWRHGPNATGSTGRCLAPAQTDGRGRQLHAVDRQRAHWLLAAESRYILRSLICWRQERGAFGARARSHAERQREMSWKGSRDLKCRGTLDLVDAYRAKQVKGQRGRIVQDIF